MESLTTIDNTNYYIGQQVNVTSGYTGRICNNKNVLMMCGYSDDVIGYQSSYDPITINHNNAGLDSPLADVGTVKTIKSMNTSVHVEIALESGHQQTIIIPNSQVATLISEIE